MTTKVIIPAAVMAAKAAILADTIRAILADETQSPKEQKLLAGLSRAVQPYLAAEDLLERGEQAKEMAVALLENWFGPEVTSSRPRPLPRAAVPVPPPVRSGRSGKPRTIVTRRMLHDARRHGMQAQD